LLAALSALDPSLPVFVEAESRKIGRLQVPDVLLESIRRAPGLCIEAPLAARVEFLLRDYDYAVADPTWLLERLGHLKGLQSNETLGRWCDMVALGDFATLVAGEQLRLVRRRRALRNGSPRPSRARRTRRANPGYICLNRWA
jgi:tRNA 2-selenouridine synthase